MAFVACHILTPLSVEGNFIRARRVPSPEEGLTGKKAMASTIINIQNTIDNFKTL